MQAHTRFVRHNSRVPRLRLTFPCQYTPPWPWPADESYSTPVQPTSVSYRFRAMYAPLYNTPEETGAPEIRFGYHAFLQLPTPLRSGATYDVTAGSWGNLTAGTTFSLAVNEAEQLNTNIRVNQVCD